MMVRYLQSVEKLSIPVNYSLVTYTDDSQISSYARNAVYSLQQAGVFARERENGQIYFRPQSYILRSETAKTVINSETLLYSVSKSVSSEQYCTIGKFSPSLILGKMYTGTTNKYRITGNWLVLYSTACFTKAPLSITDKYEVSLFVVDPFELRRSDSDTIIDRPATAIPSYLGDTSLWLHNAKSANNTYRCYYNGEASWKMVHVARLFAYETGKGLIGSAVTINTDLLN